MKEIEEKIHIRADIKTVWKVWDETYLKKGFTQGKKGHVVSDRKKGIKFKVEDVVENESLTIIWYSHFVKLIFFHEVKAFENGSMISCRVKLKGLFAFFIKLLISSRIKKYISISLKQFKNDLEINL